MKKIWMMKNVMPMRQLMTLFALLVVVAVQGANLGKHVNVSLRHDNIPPWSKHSSISANGQRPTTG